MNILWVEPGLSKAKNDTAFLLLRLKDKGAKIVVVAGRSQSLKGGGQLPIYENMNDIPIYRLYRNYIDMLLFSCRQQKEIFRLTKALEPDIIFCAQELVFPVALMIQKHFRVPIVLLVEDAGRVYSGEFYSSKQNILFNIAGIPGGRKLWPWLCKNTHTIITCHPRDQQIIKKLSYPGVKINYVPWPTYVPPTFKVPSKNRYRGVYIGSLYPFKNTQEFELAIPRILEVTPTKEFVVVGPGPHATIIKELQKKTSGLVRYIPELPREEALRLIASSYYAFTPVKRGGWGFIGDCWSMGTPIVMTHNDCYVTNGVNSLVATSLDDLVRSINRLYEEPELYEKLKQNGYQESEDRKAATVGDALNDIFTKTMNTD